MKLRIVLRRAALLLAFLILPLGLTAIPAANASTGDGYVVLANMLYGSNPVDIYLYPSGSSATSATLAMADVTYAMHGSPLAESPGTYTIAVLAAGASPSTAPEYTAQFNVKAGITYIAGPIAGPSGKKVALTTSVETPQAGKSTVEAVNATGDSGVTFHCSCAPGAQGDILANSPAGTAGGANVIPPKTWTMTATGPGGATASLDVSLVPNSVNLDIVVKTTSGYQFLNTEVTVAGTPVPGGAGTGFGGTAPRGPGSPLPWVALIGAGVLLVAGGGLRLSRARLRRLPSRG